MKTNFSITVPVLVSFFVLGCSGTSSPFSSADGSVDASLGQSSAAPDADTGSDTKPEGDRSSDTGRDTDADTGADGDSGTEDDSDTGADGDSDNEGDSGTGADTDADTDADTGEDTVSDTNAVTDAETDTDSDTGTSSEQSLTIQEGDGFCRIDGEIESEYAGYEGEGYADSINQAGAALVWGVFSEEGGPVELSIRYATVSERVCDLYVDDELAADNVTFESTTYWTTWSTVETSATLASGENLIRLEAVSTLGLPHVDSLTVTGYGLSFGECHRGGDLLISEVAIDNTDFVEILKVGTTTVELEDWSLLWYRVPSFGRVPETMDTDIASDFCNANATPGSPNAACSTSPF
jgi:hypothetical protein